MQNKEKKFERTQRDYKISRGEKMETRLEPLFNIEPKPFRLENIGDSEDIEFISISELPEVDAKLHCKVGGWKYDRKVKYYKFAFYNAEKRECSKIYSDIELMNDINEALIRNGNRIEKLKGTLTKVGDQSTYGQKTSFRAKKKKLTLFTQLVTYGEV